MITPSGNSLNLTYCKDHRLCKTGTLEFFFNTTANDHYILPELRRRILFRHSALNLNPHPAGPNP